MLRIFTVEAEVTREFRKIVANTDTNVFQAIPHQFAEEAGPVIRCFLLAQQPVLNAERQIQWNAEIEPLDAKRRVGLEFESSIEFGQLSLESLLADPFDAAAYLQ